MKGYKARPIRERRVVSLPVYKPFGRGYLNPRIDDYQEKRPAIGFLHRVERDEYDGPDEIVDMPQTRKRTS